MFSFFKKQEKLQVGNRVLPIDWHLKSDIEPSNTEPSDNLSLLAKALSFGIERKFEEVHRGTEYANMKYNPLSEYIIEKIKNDVATCKVTSGSGNFVSEFDYPINQIKKHPIQKPTFILSYKFNGKEEPTLNDYARYIIKHFNNNNSYDSNNLEMLNFYIILINCCKKTFIDNEVDLKEVLKVLNSYLLDDVPLNELINSLWVLLYNLNKDVPENGNVTFVLEYSWEDKNAYLKSNGFYFISALMFLTFLCIILISYCIPKTHDSKNNLDYFRSLFRDT